MNMLKAKSLTLGILILALLFAKTNKCFGKDAQLPFTFSISLENEVINAGEPIYVFIDFLNITNDDINFPYSGFSPGSYKFEIYDSYGVSICQSYFNRQQGGSANSRIVDHIQAGASKRYRVILNHWCSTLLPPGEYRIICYLPSYEEGSKYLAEASIKVEVVNNTKELSEKISNLENIVSGKKTDPSFNQFEALELLTYSNSPLALPSLKRLQDAYPHGMSWILKGFRNIGDTEAATALVEFINEKVNDSHWELDRETAISYVHSIYETTSDPIVRETCQPIIDSSNRSRPFRTED